MGDYLPRLVDSLLDEYLAELPAVMIVGPRACGKTTTASRHARTVVRLDSEDDAAAFRASADAALRGRAEPVLLDEWQLLPEVLGAVKRAVDDRRRAGRYLLTGSVRRDVADRFWPGTGRVVMVRMGPLTVSEQRQLRVAPFIDRVVSGEVLNGASPALDLRDYLLLALRGGLPEPALELGDNTARAWLESYAEQVALRDARSYGAAPDAIRLKRYLEAYAANSAAAPQHATLCEAAGISRKTGLAYDALLGDLMVVDEMPAWSTNRLKRLSRTRKRYVVDSGLMAGILRVGIEDVLTDRRLLGSMIDTFVVAQLRAETAVARARYRMSHLREQSGRREIDVIAELGSGRIVGIEIKAAGSVGPADARHLAWLRDEVGDRFLAGVVLHTGPDAFELGERIKAAPISTLWTADART